uniref:Sulfotransferase n=1 Tax=Sus scrofa TaxID=9823 RepID=A0A4X1V6N1_PIG
MDNTGTYLLNFKGCNCLCSFANVDYLEHLHDFEIRDDNVFIIAYPKSGKFEELSTIIDFYFQGHANVTKWICVEFKNSIFVKIVSLLSLKIIYIYRNPKDVLISYFHFSNWLLTLEPSHDIEHFMEKFPDGRVFGSLWFDHIRGWYEHRHDFNILFMMYEEMKKDLRSSVLKISSFLEKELSEEDLDAVVKQAAFENMKLDLQANYDHIIKLKMKPRTKDGHFLRTVGDWKNHLTVAQNERFDRIFQKKMKDFPFKFIRDTDEEYNQCQRVI